MASSTLRFVQLCAVYGHIVPFLSQESKRLIVRLIEKTPSSYLATQHLNILFQKTCHKQTVSRDKYNEEKNLCATPGLVTCTKNGLKFLRIRQLCAGDICGILELSGGEENRVEDRKGGCK